MKKLIFSLTIVLAINSSFAQTIIYSNDFNSLVTPALPTDFMQWNGDGLTPDPNITANMGLNFGANAWISARTSQTNIALFSTSWYSPVGTAKDWLYLPTFTVLPGTILEWDARSLSGNAADAEAYQVKITIGTTTAVANYTTIYSNPGEQGTTFITRVLSLNSYSNQQVTVAFVDNSVDKFILLLDNVKIAVPLSNDLQLTSLTSDAGQNMFGSTGTNKLVGGVITNKGLNTVTSATISYVFNNGAVVNYPINTGNLTYNQTYAFTVNSPMVTIPSPGIFPIKVWAKISGDAYANNDTLKSSYTGYSFWPSKKVLIEEGTGTWCQWCPRGAVYMDSMHKVNPTKAVLVAVHNNDAMTNAAYNTGMGTLISGYPSCTIDRKTGIDPSQIFTELPTALANFGLGNVSITSSFNESTRVLTAVATVTMAISVTDNVNASDYRLALVVTEDKVQNNAYNQANAYNGSSSNILKGAGIDWNTAGNPVPGSKMIYDFVAREIVGGYTGMTNSLPPSLTDGSVYSYTFTYTVPATYRAWFMNANALLINAKTNKIMNANNEQLANGEPKYIGINENNVTINKVDFSVFPNPAADDVFVNLNLKKADVVTIKVYNMLGSLVYSNVGKELNAGDHTLTINSSTFVNGIYNIYIVTKDGSATQKVTIAK